MQNDRESEEVLAEWSSGLEAVLYQPEVEEAIREVSHTFPLISPSPPLLPLSHPPPPPHVQVCPTVDPLDSKDFDPIDYINQLFPTEQVNTTHFPMYIAYHMYVSYTMYLLCGM